MAVLGQGRSGLACLAVQEADPCRTTLTPCRTTLTPCAPRRGGEPVTIAPASACAWTALEMVNDVYLLAGDANGIVALFDLVSSLLLLSLVLSRMSFAPAGALSKCPPMASAPRPYPTLQHAGGTLQHAGAGATDPVRWPTGSVDPAAQGQ